MILKREVDNAEVEVAIRFRLEYLICIIPFVGKLVGLVIAIFTKRLRVYVNYLLISIILYVGGGTLVYLTMVVLPPNIVSIVIRYLILLVFWFALPMYCLYQLMFFCDDVILKRYYQNGFVNKGVDYNKLKAPLFLKW